MKKSYWTIFCWKKGLKINRNLNLENLQNEIIPCLEELFPNYFISLQDGLPCHRGRKFQDFLKEKLNSRLVGNFEWPPNSPDCNSLDYFFWDKLQQKPYEGRHCKPFPSIQELKKYYRSLG